MQIPTRTVSTTGNTNTITLSTTRSTTYTTRNNVMIGINYVHASDYWTSNDGGTYILTQTLEASDMALITSVESVYLNEAIEDVIRSFAYSIDGNTITFTIIASDNLESFIVRFYVNGYAYRVNAYSYTYTFSDLPSDVNFTDIVTTAGTAYDSYSISGNSVTITWDSYYISDLSTIPTLTWVGYLTYESTKTYANVYFNGTLVDYVYFNGTRYPQ